MSEQHEGCLASRRAGMPGMSSGMKDLEMARKQRKAHQTGRAALRGSPAAVTQAQFHDVRAELAGELIS